MAPEIALTLPDAALEAVAERVALILADQAPADASAPYLSVEEAAEFLRCKPKRVYDLCSQRRIDYVKDGSRTLLRRADLIAYLEAQRG